MVAFFYILFGVGVLYTVVTFFIGQLMDFADIDVDFDMENFSSMPVSPLKPMIIAAFLTAFGGLGLIFLHRGWGNLVTILIALLGALLICTVIYYFVMVPLYRAQNTSAVAQSHTIGYKAKVTVPIENGKYGKIKYTINGNTYSAPAKSFSGGDLRSGEEVLIIDIKKNVYYVDAIKKGDL